MEAQSQKGMPFSQKVVLPRLRERQMVEAGWCYNPLPEYDDCVMCFYCGTSLDGWEPKDDPMKEHKKRAEDCHFFTLVEESKKSKRGKGKRAARGSKASRASTMTVDSEQVSFAGTDLDDPTAEGESMLSTTSTASRATRGRSRTVKGKSTRATKAAKQDSFLELALDEPAAEESAAPEQTSKRGRTKRATAQKGDDSGLGAADAEPEAKPKKAPTRARTKQAAKDDLIIEPDASMISTQTETRTTRGRKRTSDGKEKLDSSVILVEEKPATRPASKSKSKRAPPNKKPVDIAIDEEPQFEEPAAQTESAAEEEPQPSKPAKKKAASRKQKSSESEQTYSKAPMQSCLTEDGGDKENPQSLARKPIASPERPASKPTQIFSPSPQSSDAENVPPSSRPSAGKRAPLSPVHQLQQPLQTPRTSPSKRNNTIGGLKSTAPWTQIDLDAALLPSPTAAAAWAPQHMKLDEVLDSMTSPEKQMTVEAWILHNASRAETALRNECERMIVQFEDEGNRAVQAVEGIDCVS